MSGEKLKIIGYKKSPDEPGAQSDCIEFVPTINPEKFKYTRSVNYNSNDTSNTSKDIKQFQGYGSDQLNFDLIFDGTGIIQNEKTVDQEIEELHKVVYDYLGSTHRPHFIHIIWGEFGMKAQLSNIQLDYQMFGHDGRALRAKAALTFIGHCTTKSQILNANNQSPDMTHIKTVRVGDSLPTMCMDIYDDAKYFIQIAQINGLSNFRNLVVGSQLIFPPLEK